MGDRFLLHAARLDHFAPRDVLDRLSKRYSIALREGPYERLIAHLERVELQPEAILIEVSGDARSILSSLDQLANQISGTTRVYAAGTINDIEFYRQLLALGLADYIVLPSTAADLEALFQNFYTIRGKSRGCVIGYVGLAGGVGVSTFAINFANHIAEFRDGRVSLIDASPALYSWADRLRRDEDKDERLRVSDDPDPPMRNQIDVITVKSGFDLVLPKAEIETQTDGHERLQNLRTYIQSRLDSGERICLDVGTTSYANRLLELCDHFVLIGEPDVRSLQCLSAFKHYLSEQFPYAQQHLVLNKIGLRGRMEFEPDDFKAQFGIMPCLAYRHDPAAASRAWTNRIPILSQSLLKKKDCFTNLLQSLDPVSPERPHHQTLQDKIKQFIRSGLK